MKKKLLLFTVFVLTIVFGLKAQQVNSWEFASDLEGWGSPHNAVASHVGGALAVEVIGDDPSVSHPFSPDWNVGDLKYLWMRVNNTTSDNGGEMYFFHAGGFMLLSFPLTPNDTEYKDIYIDLTQNAVWTPGLNINSIRLDIINGNAGETGFAYVDFVRFLNDKPNPTSILVKGLGNATEISGIGSTLQMSVDVLPLIGSTDVIWSVDNDALATISETGLLTAIAEGNVTVTATSKGDPTVKNSLLISITSEIILISEITVNSAGAEIKGIGNTLQMSVLFTPANATNKNVTYSVDKPEIATIDEVTGLLTSVSVGTVIVTATSQDGTNISGSRSIVVYTGQKNAWEFKYDLEGWGGTNGGTATVVDGAMEFNVTGADPYIIGPQANPAWSADGLNTMWIRIKNTTADTEGALYMLLDGTSGGGYESVTFPVTPNDTEYRDIYVDMTTLLKWNNSLKIVFFRLDPIGGTNTGMVYVDFIRFIYQEKPLAWVNPPAIAFATQYTQTFSGTWEDAKFNEQWNCMEPGQFGESDIASGYLQFVWPAKRILYSKTDYTSPYTFTADLDFSAGSSRAGLVIRAFASNVLNADFIQEPIADPGFNREGIAFYPTDDGSAMNVQFSGDESGQATTVVTTIPVPKPADVTSLRDRGTIRIEDFGTSIYIFYNDAPYIRIDLGNEVDGVYTTGTVYTSTMQVAGTFTGMEVLATGKVAIAQRDAALRLYSAEIKTAVPWDARPAVTFTTKYNQVFADAWDNEKFYGEWDALEANAFSEADNTAGYLQFVWVTKRVICSKNTYASPYTFETDIDYSAGSNRGGVVLRVGPFNEWIQDPGVDPGFNREGIAIYPALDGGSMIVQFSGVEAGATTPITKITVPKPEGVTSLMSRGTLRIEDFGASIYIFYNGAPYIRIDFSDNTGAIYTSGTVYNSGMVVQGTFSQMEVELLGKIAVAQRDASLRLYSATIQTSEDTGDMLSDRPEATFEKIDETTFVTWDQTKFESAWDRIGALGASNVVTGVDGYLMLGWIEPRVIATKSVYTIPNIVEADFGFPVASESGGVIIRVDPTVGIDNLQEPGEILNPPLFNREGIAFFPTNDGSGMNVQFSGAISEGDGYSTPIKRINVPAPDGVNLRDRGILRIEDFGTAIYVFYNDIPFLRVNLEGKIGQNYTSGTVYNAKMVPQGVFSGMEIFESGKVGMAARQAALSNDDLHIYRITIKTPATVPDAPTEVVASASNAQASVAFTAPVVNGGSEIISYTVTSTPGNLTQTGTSSPLVVTGLTNETAYTFTVIATNAVGNSIESAISNEVTPLDNTALKDNQPSAIKVYQSGSALIVDMKGLSGLQNVYLFDLLGKPVVSKQASGGEKLEISNRLTSGVYIVKIQDATKTRAMKIIVK
jgi:hypothetical protein